RRGRRPRSTRNIPSRKALSSARDRRRARGAGSPWACANADPPPCLRGRAYATRRSCTGSSHCPAPCRRRRPSRRRQGPRRVARARRQGRRRTGAGGRSTGCRATAQACAFVAPPRSPLVPRAGRMIAAVDLRVAVLARTPDHALARRAAEQRRAGGLLRAVDLPRMADRRVVALLAQDRPGDLQQLVVIRSVRVVAVQAALAHRPVLPEERVALLGVAGVADVVDAISLPQGRCHRGARDMSDDARPLPLWHRRVRALAEFGALLRMALVARLRYALAHQQAGGRDALHRVVAIGAADLVVRVHRSGPVQPVPTLVAAEALAVLHLDRRSPRLREADDQRLVGAALRMRSAGPVAGLADARLVLVLGIQPEGLRVQRVLEMLVLLSMAGDAGLLADVLGDGLCARGLRTGGAGEQQRAQYGDDVRRTRQRRSPHLASHPLRTGWPRTAGLCDQE